MNLIESNETPKILLSIAFEDDQSFKLSALQLATCKQTNLLLVIAVVDIE